MKAVTLSFKRVQDPENNGPTDYTYQVRSGSKVLEEGLVRRHRFTSIDGLLRAFVALREKGAK